MIVMTYDGLVGSDPVIYVDGLGRSTTEVSPPAGAYGSDVGNDIYFGDDVASANPFGGNIQMAMMWTRQLDADEIQAIYDATKDQFQPSNLSIPAGIPREDLAFFIDEGNQQSLPNTASSGIRDLLGNASAGLLDGVTITDSHMNFDGTDDNINFTKGAPLDDIFNTAAGATVMVWCRPETAVNQTLVSTRGASTDDGWALELQASQNVRFVHDRATVDYSTNSQFSDVVLNQWNSVTARGTATSVGLLIDGKPLAQAGSSGSGAIADDTGNDLYIGEEEAGTNSFDGDIALVLMWSRQLSNAEIKLAHDAIRQRFTPQGMILIDTITLTASGTSITFDGLNGNYDGTYYITGRCSNVPASGPIALEARPNGLTTNMGSVTGNHQSTSSVLVSTTGWLLGGWAIPEGASDGSFVVDAWIYPEENKGGSTSTASGRRMYRGVATNLIGTVSTSNIVLTDTGGYWNEATTNMTSLDIVAAIGTMDTGTSFSLYYIEDAD
jgi:hypothetical protein